jgi:hypothetical protein
MEGNNRKNYRGVSGRRLTRVVAQYIRARQPARISLTELRVAMQEEGYLTGNYEASRKRLQRVFKSLEAELSQPNLYV